MESKHLMCCVCIEDINIEHNYISCSLCRGCNVCYNCSLSMLENGQLSHCPVCRQDNWYNTTTLSVIQYDNSDDDKSKKCMTKIYQLIKKLTKLLFIIFNPLIINKLLSILNIVITITQINK